METYVLVRTLSKKKKYASVDDRNVIIVGICRYVKRTFQYNT